MEYQSARLNFSHFAESIRQISAPKSAIKLHKSTVLPQPFNSEYTAIPAAENALPIYVQKLSNPDINEMFPNRPKYGGIIQVIIKFAPCLLPVKIAAIITENITETPFSA